MSEEVGDHRCGGWVAAVTLAQSNLGNAPGEGEAEVWRVPYAEGLDLGLGRAAMLLGSAGVTTYQGGEKLPAISSDQTGSCENSPRRLGQHDEDTTDYLEG